MIFGSPGKTEADRVESIRGMESLGGVHDNVTFSHNPFTPYSGISVWPKLERAGLGQPDSLEDWAAYTLGGVRLMWLDADALAKLDASLARLRQANKLARRIRHAGRATQSNLRAMRRSLLTGGAA